MVCLKPVESLCNYVHSVDGVFGAGCMGDGVHWLRSTALVNTQQAASSGVQHLALLSRLLMSVIYVTCVTELCSKHRCAVVVMHQIQECQVISQPLGSLGTFF